MIVRRIRPEEYKRTGEVMCIAFEFVNNNQKTAEETVNQLIENPRGRGDIYFRERYAAFQDDDKTMMSFIVATPYDVKFDGNVCKMTGIGGVSTLPQYRRRGGIRACFELSLNDMYENGYAFSYLFPFSTNYYRKFGYEVCCESIQYYVSLHSFKPFDVKGHCELMESSKKDYLEDVKKIYNDFKQGINLMVEREDYDFGWVNDRDPAKDKSYSYVYYDENNEPKGFMILGQDKLPNNPYRFNLNCREFMFSDIEGFKGLLNQALAYSTYYEHVVFRLPIHMNVSSYIPEWTLYFNKRERYFNGMVEVVNVKKVLEMAKYKGDGSLNILVKNSIVKQNNDTFEVVFENDRAKSVTSTDKAPDIELDIKDFSRLIVGSHDVNELNYLEDVKVNSDLEKIGKVFYKKPCFVADHF